jgi:hypothetical protein
LLSRVRRDLEAQLRVRGFVRGRDVAVRLEKVVFDEELSVNAVSSGGMRFEVPA